MKPGCIGKSNTNFLPAPTDLTENPYGKKTFFCFGVSQKSASVVRCGILIESVPRSSTFEKCSHLREKGGVLTKIWASTFREPASGPFRAGQQFQNINNVQFYIQRGSNDYQILTVGIC
jgi:hypothetical protein